jgi:type IV secretion system protein VirB10
VTSLSATEDTEADFAQHDVRPVVGWESGNRPLWIAISGIGLAGLLLFGVLESRRAALTAPPVRARAADLASAPSSLPPPLYIPPEPILFRPEPQALAPAITQLPARVAAQQEPPPRYIPPQTSSRPETNAPQSSPVPPPAVSNSAAIVYDASASEGEPGSSSAASGGTASTSRLTASATRARASRGINRATIVPQGTLIAAVLETALDSTQPGLARALVSRDVANLRGERILIPRGSRLFGEYSGTIDAGQNRAQVQWTRLVRPDGVTIAIESPAADRLGRAGIRGQVNTHFFERLSGALLQSSIDVGAAVAARSASNSSVVVAIPGSVQSVTSDLIGPAPKPTLKIKQGARISVFVVRDLDFTAVEARR